MERRLTAILSADVVGCSRLMGADEGGTLERLKACRRELVDPATSPYRRHSEFSCASASILGDIIVEGDDIYGDGANIAARLQAIAQPGGICISGTAFDHAAHKADVGFSALGEQHLKNIADPVRVYRVLLDPSEAGKVVAAPRAGRAGHDPGNVLQCC